MEGTRESLASDTVLVMSLQTAVPLWIMQFQLYAEEDVLKIAQEAGQFIACHGDNILFRGAKKGDSARAFNELAKGLAAIALLVPGGVDFAGVHWEAGKPGALALDSSQDSA
jgi:hypothetical protein